MDTLSTITEEARSSRSEENRSLIIELVSPNPKVGVLLKKVPLFAHLTKHEREKVGGALRECSFYPGTMVLKEGQSSDLFFIVKQGTASVLKIDLVTKKSTLMHKLSEGDHFGESAILLKSEKLTSSVRADTFLVLWSLNKILFKNLFNHHRIEITFAMQDALTREVRRSVNTDTIEDLIERPIPRVEMRSEKKESILLALKKNPIFHSKLFQHFDEKSLDTLIQTMELREVMAGETIIEEGEDGGIFYIIKKGEVDVFQKDDKTQKEKKVDHHCAGSSFGELAFIHNDIWNATVRAATNVQLRELRRTWVVQVVTEIVSSNEINTRKWLNNVKLLSSLTNAERACIAEVLEVITITEAEVIFKQGDEGNDFYIIAEGVVSFSAVDFETGKSVEMKKSTLGKGEYFGERALINNKPRAATATTNGPCKLLKLDTEAFIQLLGPLQNILKKTAKDYEKTEETTKKWKPSGIPFHDLKYVGVLGRGSYGFVQLVKDKNNNPYALKAISKQRIVDTRQKCIH